MSLLCRTLTAGLLASAALAASAVHADVRATLAWRYSASTGACEIACYAPEREQFFVTVGEGVDIVDASSGQRVGAIERPAGLHPTSVAHSREWLAVAWAADDEHQRGQIGVYSIESNAPRKLRTFEAGYLPDMLTFSPDGRYLVVANEGQPTNNYEFDPPGSVSVIDMSEGLDAATAREATFTEFDSQRDELRARGVRVFGPSKSQADGQATVAQDMEPEYIAVSSNSRRAWVSLQENNAIAEVNLATCRIEAIHSLGTVNYRRCAGARPTRLDASDRDGGPRICHWPVLGMYQPDGIAVVQHRGKEYLLTANEGDPRRYRGFNERCRVGKLANRGINVDDRIKARLPLKEDQLGRLEVSIAAGDADGDQDLDALHSFGTRSFAVWRMEGRRPPVQVFDSGDEFERVTAHEAADRYNAECGEEPDDRSPKRGPEPESIAVGCVGRTLVAAIGLERTGGAMLYDISNPTAPVFLKYVPPVSQDGVTDCAPEGVLMVPANVSPFGKSLLVLCHEVSGTMTAYTLER